MATKKVVDIDNKTKKKNSRISVNKLEKIMKEHYSPTTQIEWNDITVNIKRHLSLSEMLEFTNSVVDSCFFNNTGEYLPEIKEFAIKVCVLTMYANFTLPQNTDKQYDLIFKTDVLNIVYQHIDLQQLNEIYVAIDKKIDYLVSVNIESVENKIKDLYETMNSIVSKLTDIYKDIDSDTLLNIAEAIGENRLDANKLMDAYFEKKELNQNNISAETPVLSE